MRVLCHVNNEMLGRLRAEFPDVEFVDIPRDGELEPAVKGDVLVTSPIRMGTTAAALERGVRWVHTIGTGVDRFPLELIQPGVTLTCSRGASAIGIAEWTLTMMLAFEKDLPASWITAPPDRWFSANLGALYGRTLGVVGMGGIGERAAHLALAFDMKVKALRRSMRPATLDGVTIVGTLTDVLADADHVLIAAPLTPETHHLIGRTALSAMKPGVHLVNIARGGLIDQDALRGALDSGHVARASLDTVDPEPLPEGHWLYTHPRVRLSPHISWCMPDAYLPMYESFAENLRRFVAGAALLNVVDVASGY